MNSTNSSQTARYSPKSRQQIVSNKLLNSELYNLYTIRKLGCSGDWLKANIVDGTITIAKQTYVLSWLDVAPIVAMQKGAMLILSLRSPRFREVTTGAYPLAYCLVTLDSYQEESKESKVSTITLTVRTK